MYIYPDSSGWLKVMTSDRQPPGRETTEGYLVCTQKHIIIMHIVYENILRHRYLFLHTGSSFRPLWFTQQRHLKSRWTTCFQACRHAARPNNDDSFLKVYFFGHIILLRVQRKSHYNEKLSRYFQKAQGNNYGLFTRRLELNSTFV